MCSPFQPPPSRLAAVGSLAAPWCSIVQRGAFRIAREVCDAALRRMCRMFTSSSCSYDLRSTPYKADHGDTCVCAQLTGVSERAPALCLDQRDSNQTDVTLIGSWLGPAAMEKLWFRLLKE